MQLKIIPSLYYHYYSSFKVKNTEIIEEELMEKTTKTNKQFTKKKINHYPTALFVKSRMKTDV